MAWDMLSVSIHECYNVSIDINKNNDLQNPDRGRAEYDHFIFILKLEFTDWLAQNDLKTQPKLKKKI